MRRHLDGLGEDVRCGHEESGNGPSGREVMPEQRQVAGRHGPGRARSGRSMEKSAANEVGKAGWPQSWRGWNARLRIISGIINQILNLENVISSSIKNVVMEEIGIRYIHVGKHRDYM